MKKVYIFFLILIFLVGMNSFVMGQSEGPSVKIDGKLCDFNPSAQIKDGRTMVPVRFVIENQSINGKVEWNARDKKVIIEASGKHIEFEINSLGVLVDGKVVYMDTVPYIYENRTFIPLRFLTETLGAKVEWLGEEYLVNIHFSEAEPVVFAYYYYHAFEEFKKHADNITDLACRWFETDGDGNLFYEYKDDYEDILSFARSKGIKTHASVVLMGKEPLHSLLTNFEHRQKLINNLCEEVENNGYDGVNIDFEFFYPSDKGNLNLFLQELKASLRSDKTLTVAVFACTAKQNWDTGYDYKSIGSIADQVVVMAYDYHYKTSGAGPVAPLWWVEEVLDYMTTVIPREKILLGMPTYGYNWGEGASTATVTAGKLKNIEKNYQLTERFDYDSMSPSYTYTDNNKVYHQIWMENETSLSKKWDMAIDKRLGGISFWRIGTGFEDLYNMLESKQ